MVYIQVWARKSVNENEATAGWKLFGEVPGDLKEIYKAKSDGMAPFQGIQFSVPSHEPRVMSITS